MQVTDLYPKFTLPCCLARCLAAFCWARTHNSGPACAYLRHELEQSAIIIMQRARLHAVQPHDVCSNGKHYAYCLPEVPVVLIPEVSSFGSAYIPGPLLNPF